MDAFSFIGLLIGAGLLCGIAALGLLARPPPDDTADGGKQPAAAADDAAASTPPR